MIKCPKTKQNQQNAKIRVISVVKNLLIDQYFHSKFDLKVIFYYALYCLLIFSIFQFPCSKKFKLGMDEKGFYNEKSENALKMSTWLCF